MIREEAANEAIDWLDEIDPGCKVTAESSVVKLIEECVEFLRADTPEEKLSEMADILICAVQAAYRLDCGSFDLNNEIIRKVRLMYNDRKYYVKNGKIMREKDGRSH